MMRSQPFARAAVMFAAIGAAFSAAAALAGQPLARQAFLQEQFAKIGPYKSRGHGGRKCPRHPSKRFVAGDKRAVELERARIAAWLKPETQFMYVGGKRVTVTRTGDKFKVDIAVPIQNVSMAFSHPANTEFKIIL